MSLGTPFVQRLDALLETNAVLEHGLLTAASDEIERLRSELLVARNSALDEAIALVADTDRWWTRDLFGPDDAAEFISVAIKALKTP